jgi:hypothetical protein
VRRAENENFPIAENGSTATRCRLRMAPDSVPGSVRPVPAAMSPGMTPRRSVERSEVELVLTAVPVGGRGRMRWQPDTTYGRVIGRVA